MSIETKEKFNIMGMGIFPFGIFATLVLIATFVGVLPGGMIGAIPLMIILGAILDKIGNNTPIIKDFFGGGPIVVIFGSAALFTAYNLSASGAGVEPETFALFPEYSSKIIVQFMKGGAFLKFYIAILITGSILGMNRNLLIKAAVRYLPAILGGVICALALVGITGFLIGYGAKEAILYIGVPIMGGGMGAGAVPLSEIFAENFSVDPKEMMSKMVPALALGNAMAIVVGSLLNKIGKIKPSITGEGKLMKINESEFSGKEIEKTMKDETKVDYHLIGIGVFIASTFFVFGNLLHKVIPGIHTYALMIISVAIIKALGLMPKKYENGAFQAFQLIMITMTPALLVGIGVAYTDLMQVVDALSLNYILLVSMTVIGSVIGSGFVGKIVGFYPIESSITAGLCMANMGGTGDVAVLSASKRMQLMPFAQISSRLGGAFILILATMLLKI